ATGGRGRHRPSCASEPRPSEGLGDGRHAGGALLERAQRGEEGAEAEDRRGDPRVIERRGEGEDREAEREDGPPQPDDGPGAEPDAPRAGTFGNAARAALRQA